VGRRIKRLTEAIAILKGCFAEGPFSLIFLGGGGKRLLPLAAREAQIIARARAAQLGLRSGNIQDLSRRLFGVRSRHEALRRRLWADGNRRGKSAGTSRSRASDGTHGTLALWAPSTKNEHK
jgi:hypothetical protein